MSALLTKITLAMFFSHITPMGFTVKAIDVRIGRDGVNAIVNNGSNRSSKNIETRTVQACIIAAIGKLHETGQYSSGGAQAARRWVDDGKPSFSVSMADFRKAVPGKSHHRSGWNSKRKGFENASSVNIYGVDIIASHDKDRIHFVPIR